MRIVALLLFIASGSFMGFFLSVGVTSMINAKIIGILSGVIGGLSGLFIMGASKNKEV